MFGLALSVQNPTFTKKNVLSWVELCEQLPIVFFKSLNAIESLNEARTIKEKWNTYGFLSFAHADETAYSFLRKQLLFFYRGKKPISHFCRSFSPAICDNV